MAAHRFRTDRSPDFTGSESALIYVRRRGRTRSFRTAREIRSPDGCVACAAEESRLAKPPSVTVERSRIIIIIAAMLSAILKFGNKKITRILHYG